MPGPVELHVGFSSHTGDPHSHKSFFRSGRRVCLSSLSGCEKVRPESDSRTSDNGTGTDHHAGDLRTFCSSV